MELNLVSVTSGVRVSAESPQLRDSIAAALNNHPLELHAVDVGMYLGLRRPAAEVENLLQGFADMKADSLRLIILGRMGGHDEQRMVGNETRMSSDFNHTEDAGIPSLRRAAFEVRGIPVCAGRINLNMDD